MTVCASRSTPFATCNHRRLEVSFAAGDITSDAGGALLLRQAEKRLGLLRDIAATIGDDRRRKSVQHSVHALLVRKRANCPLAQRRRSIARSSPASSRAGPESDAIGRSSHVSAFLMDRGTTQPST